MGSRDIRLRAEQMYGDLPAHLQYRSDLFDSDIAPDTLFSLTIGYLDHLQNLFLLARVSKDHTEDTGQDFVDTARATLEAVLNLWSHRDRLVDYRSDLIWNVSTETAELTTF